MLIVKVDELVKFSSTEPDQRLCNSKEGSNSFDSREIERLISYYSHKETCAYALQQLIDGYTLIEKNDNTFLYKWVSDFKSLGAESLLMFSIDFLDHYKSGESGCLYLPLSNIYVERVAFNSMVHFDSIFQILHWEMEIGIRDRDHSSQIEIDYYRVEIDTNPLKRVLDILNDYISTLDTIQ